MRRILLVAALVFGTISSASASQYLRITVDRGGKIGDYIQRFTQLRDSGARVVIDGNCFSACTLITGLLPRNQFCVTPYARLGFHAAWLPDVMGTPTTSPEGTRALWDIYPSNVRGWIVRHGGLTQQMIYLQGPALGILPQCPRTWIREALAQDHRRDVGYAQVQQYPNAGARY